MFIIKNIKTFTKNPNYVINQPILSLLRTLERYKEEHNLNLDPDFQRLHVWNEEKQEKFVEYLFRGGISGKDIYFNCPGWMDDFKGPMELVDGKQRIEAVTKFLKNELSIFGSNFYSDFEPRDLLKLRIDLNFHVHNLRTRKDILQWYIDLNEGGVAHTKEEIDKVYKLLEKENSKET